MNVDYFFQFPVVSTSIFLMESHVYIDSIVVSLPFLPP